MIFEKVESRDDSYRLFDGICGTKGVRLVVEGHRAGPPVRENVSAAATLNRHRQIWQDVDVLVHWTLVLGQANLGLLSLLATGENGHFGRQASTRGGWKPQAEQQTGTE